jgi:hypothetical protein
MQLTSPLFFLLLLCILLLHFRKHLEKSISDERQTWQELCTDNLCPILCTNNLCPNLDRDFGRGMFCPNLDRDYLCPYSDRDFLCAISSRVELDKHGRFLFFFSEDFCHTHARVKSYVAKTVLKFISLFFFLFFLPGVDTQHLKVASIPSTSLC